MGPLAGTREITPNPTSVGRGAAGAGFQGGREILVRGPQRCRPGAGPGELPAEFGLAHAGFPGPAQCVLRDRLAFVVAPLAGLARADARQAADAHRLQRATVRWRRVVVMEVAVAVIADALEQRRRFHWLCRWRGLAVVAGRPRAR